MAIPCAFTRTHRTKILTDLLSHTALAVPQPASKCHLTWLLASLHRPPMAQSSHREMSGTQGPHESSSEEPLACKGLLPGVVRWLRISSIPPVGFVAICGEPAYAYRNNQERLLEDQSCRFSFSQDLRPSTATHYRRYSMEDARKSYDRIGMLIPKAVLVVSSWAT